MFKKIAVGLSILSLLIIFIFSDITFYEIRTFINKNESVTFIAIIVTLIGGVPTLWFFWDKMKKKTKIKKPLPVKKSFSPNESSSLVENLFFPASGPLPPDASSYIRRISDDELAMALEAKTLPDINLPIIITGEFRVGKSSLLNRAMQAPFFTKGKWKDCHIDLQNLRTDDSHLLRNDVFKVISESLGKTITSWSDKNLIIQPIVFRIDEFGELKCNSNVAEQFISNLYSFMIKNNEKVRIIACLPGDKNDMQDFIKDFDKSTLNNPKYLIWKNVFIECFEKKEIQQLLSLLPKRVAKIAIAQYDTIFKLSSGNPLDLQCLCFKLFKAAHNKQNKQALIAIINHSDSYEYP